RGNGGNPLLHVAGADESSTSRWPGRPLLGRGDPVRNGDGPDSIQRRQLLRYPQSSPREHSGTAHGSGSRNTRGAFRHYREGAGEAAVSPLSDGGGISGSPAGPGSSKDIGLRFHPYRDLGCPKPSCSVQNAFFSRLQVVGPGGARNRQEK